MGLLFPGTSAWSRLDTVFGEVEKRGHPTVVAALNDVLRMVWDVVAGKTSHAQRLNDSIIQL
jgi:hypothetical protein